jgi:cell wall-associated NlpC family hydrolase
MDRRLTPFSGRIALDSLQGQVEAAGFVSGELASVTAPLADLLAKPFGARDRQVLLGDTLLVIDHDRGHVFVQAQKDEYCGWLADTAVGPAFAPTHWVAARSSHLYAAPRVQALDLTALPFGARLCVTAMQGGFATTAQGFVPLAHLRSKSDRPSDPVSVAESLLGAPYLWGGNSGAGIDCSGLVQTARLACGLTCPGDSDQQQALGEDIGMEVPCQRGDLLFWKGHVAMAMDEERLIHANGHAMAVVIEDISACIIRIAAQGGGPLVARKRP